MNWAESWAESCDLPNYLPNLKRCFEYPRCLETLEEAEGEQENTVGQRREMAIGQMEYSIHLISSEHKTREKLRFHPSGGHWLWLTGSLASHRRPGGNWLIGFTSSSWKKGVDADEKLLKLPYPGGGNGPGRIVITSDGKILRFAE